MRPIANIGGAAEILDEPEFEYKQYPWGDLIYGTAEQLQRIGIGRGIAFPSTADERSHRKCLDPRGFETVITSKGHRGAGIFSASIEFPGRDRPGMPLARPFAFGITKQESSHQDIFVGTAEALTAAGIVPAGHFPGDPGMLTSRVTILPDGVLPKGAHHATCAAAHEPGAKTIERKSRSRRATFEVRIVLPMDVKERRVQAEKIRFAEWEMRMRALPRPAPLVDLPGQSSKPARCLRAEGNVIYLFGGAR